MNNGWAHKLREDYALLLGGAAIGAALLTFLKLASEVMEGESRAFDAAILQQVRSATSGDGPVAEWLRSFMLDVTALGNNNILILIAATAAGYLLVEHRRKLALCLAAGLGLGGLLEILLKQIFARDRPDVVTHLVDVTSASFPSGHAMDSAMVYLTIAALLSRAATGLAARIYIYAVAVALTMLIGLSRLYLGVHWPTDVLAGWIMGTIWAALCSFAAHRFTRATR